MEIKSVKMVKSYNKCFFFRFGQTLFNLAHMSAVHHEKGSVHAFFKVSFDRLFDDLASRKRNYCFEKKSGKSLEVWIQKSAQTLCYVVGETCKETLSAFHLDQTVLEVLFRNQMKWTISVWADWNSISVKIYPLVPFISIFSPNMGDIRESLYESRAAPTLYFFTKLRPEGPKRFFLESLPPTPLSQGLDELLFCLSKPIAFLVLADVAVVLK